MEKEQIIKALECCLVQDANCPECPYTGTYPECQGYVGNQALSLIREQDKRIEEIKAAAVQKMADRLKTYYGKLSGNTSPILTVYHIDQIAKEILEET